MNTAFVFKLLWSRRWLIALVAIMTVAAGYAFATQRAPRYTSTATIVLSFGEAGPFDQSSSARQFAAPYFATQIDILKSRRVADEALRALPDADLTRLAKEHIGDYFASRLANEETWQKLVASVLEKLRISTARESRVVGLEFTSIHPDLAAAMANGFAQAYITTSLELSVGPARRNAEWFDQQLVTLRDRLEEKQSILTSYQKEKGIVSYDERLDSEVRRYETLAADLVEAQSRTFELRAGQLGSQHPEFRRAVEQERAVRQSLERQESRVFQVKEERDKLELLRQDVVHARNAYDVALQEYFESTMESQFNQTDVAILSRATPTVRSKRTVGIRRLVGAGVLGLFLGALFAIVAEMMNRKIRTEDDIVEGVDLSVIASI